VATPLQYALRPARRGAPWWLWALVLLAVLTWVGLLAPFKRKGDPEATRRAAADIEVRNLRLALDVFARDIGRYPSALEGLGVLVRPAGLNHWHGPYVFTPGVQRDPWSHPYVYAPGPNGSPPQVISLGPDGKLGTADDIVSP
jgi:general secretion pathway protein G